MFLTMEVKDDNRTEDNKLVKEDKNRIEVYRVKDRIQSVSYVYSLLGGAKEDIWKLRKSKYSMSCLLSMTIVIFAGFFSLIYELMGKEGKRNNSIYVLGAGFGSLFLECCWVMLKRDLQFHEMYLPELNNTKNIFNEVNELLIQLSYPEACFGSNSFTQVEYQNEQGIYIEGAQVIALYDSINQCGNTLNKLILEEELIARKFNYVASQMGLFRKDKSQADKASTSIVNCIAEYLDGSNHYSRIEPHY